MTNMFRRICGSVLALLLGASALWAGADDYRFEIVSTDHRVGLGVTIELRLTDLGVDRTWGSCGAFSVCDGQPTIENCGPCDGYSVSPFGRPTHPPALSHAGIGNVIN